MLTKIFSPLFVIVLWACSAYAQDTIPTFTDWNFHFQQTVIGQIHPDFPASYSGANSIAPHEKDRYSVTSTVFFGKRLWTGGELYIDPELAGGQGLSGSSGVAGALNGETYRIGNPSPELAIPFGRIYLQENIGFSDSMV